LVAGMLYLFLYNSSWPASTNYQWYLVTTKPPCPQLEDKSPKGIEHWQKIW
jgi:hypothetical protein